MLDEPWTVDEVAPACRSSSACPEIHVDAETIALDMAPCDRVRVQLLSARAQEPGWPARLFDPDVLVSLVSADGDKFMADLTGCDFEGDDVRVGVFAYFELLPRQVP